MHRRKRSLPSPSTPLLTTCASPSLYTLAWRLCPVRGCAPEFIYKYSDHLVDRVQGAGARA